MHIKAEPMEAASTSETSVNFYQTARRNIPEDSYLHTRRRKNLKSKIAYWLLISVEGKRISVILCVHPCFGLSSVIFT
jgi:hypothetical protein